MAQVAKQEKMRKGPWTEQEDVQLVWFVRLFGERRWDLLAKVSGLNRTGKSCRLRWVNYLNPGLKRGRMTPEEEHLVVELHAKWGNRWSRIARRLPGRTDNEIKNYWRTHMRKKAQERKKSSSSSSASSSTSSSSSNFFSSAKGPAALELGTDPKHDMDSTTEGSSSLGAGFDLMTEEGLMDQIWNEIAASNSVSELDLDDAAACNVSAPSMPFPVWQDCYDSLWRIDDDEFKMLSDLLMSSKHLHSKAPYQHA